jgi:branched-chain amino acid transport system permease protein
VWSSFQFVIYVIIGGSGTLFGPALGVLFVTILEQAIQSFGKWNQIVFGLLIVLVVMVFPGGLWGAFRWAGSAATTALRLGRPENEAAR